MNRDEARVLTREFYRIDRAGVTDTYASDGRPMRRVSVPCSNHVGIGVAADPVVATAYAWRNLKRKAGIR